MPRTRASHTVGDWTALSEKVTPEVTADQPFLEHVRALLQGSLDEITTLMVERDFHQARNLEASKRIREILDKGRREATLLRKALKERHGPDSEQLAAFGIQPHRGRKRRAAVDPQHSGDPAS